MHHIPTTATAVEKLRLEAKSYRKANGCPFNEALEIIAVQAGYTSWKHVTVCAAATPRAPDSLLPAHHRHLLTYAELRNSDGRLKRVTSVEELCEVLGIQPYFARQRCDQAPAGQHCLCELDPFATSIQNNVLVDLGDKYDHHNLLFMHSRPAREYSGSDKRHYFGLATTDAYPNEHLTESGNRDRSNALNPNNPAHQAGLDNRAMQLNPENWRFGGADDQRELGRGSIATTFPSSI